MQRHTPVKSGFITNESPARTRTGGFPSSVISDTPDRMEQNSQVPPLMER